jgi:hypothetical protein
VRAVLDHVLALVSAAECGESLVLRGSATMLAYAGAAAREPGDLDWVVRPALGVSELAWPYAADLDSARVWPEAAHGAGRGRMWDFEDFDTGGLAPRVPPEGLHWVEDAEPDRPHEAVVSLLEESPAVGGGVTIEADRIAYDGSFGYAYDTGGAAGGVRLLVPWRAAGGATGSVQLDFAYDEDLPEAPRLLAVPRADGGPPTVAWAASPELSLAWKLRWMSADQAAGGCAWKDLYDAVLLAELPGMRVPDRLLRRVSPELGALTPDTIRSWRVESAAGPGRGDKWLARLARAWGD